MKVSWMGWDESQLDGMGGKSVGWDGIEMKYIGRVEVRGIKRRRKLKIEKKKPSIKKQKMVGDYPKNTEVG